MTRFGQRERMLRQVGAFMFGGVVYVVEEEKGYCALLHCCSRTAPPVLVGAA